jgi:hypothetical protein
MAVLPTFQPESRPGSTGAAAINSLGATQQYFSGQQSMMERASHRRMSEESHALQMHQAELLRPVLEAKAKADEADAGAKLAAVRRTEEMRAKAAGIADQARGGFNDLMLIEDPEAREQAAFEWIGRYGQLASVKEYEGEWNSMMTAIGKVQLNASGIRTLTAKTEAEKDVLRERSLVATAAEKELIKARGEQQIEVAKVRATVPPRNEFMGIMSALTQAKADGDTEAEEFFRGRLARLSHIPASRRLEIESLLDLKRAAEEAGDEEAAAVYEDRIAKVNTIVIDPMKQAIATRIGGGPAPAKPPAKQAAPSAPKEPAKMSDAELESFMFGPKK